MMGPTMWNVACSVCLGDPDSKMVQGVVWGIVTLLAFIVPVLGMIGGMAIFWVRRAKKLANENTEAPKIEMGP